MNNKGNIKDIYKLSPMQESMYFNALYDKQSSSGFSQACYSIKGELDIPTVEKSINELFKWHNVLRTSFVHEKLDHPVQVVFKERKADFSYEDLRSLRSEAEREDCLQQIKAQDKRQLFDLNKGTLFRVKVVQLSDRKYEFIWSHHHIIMDGWCSSILIAQFYAIYSALLKGEECSMPAITPYRDYIKWLDRQDREQARQYWKQALEDYYDVSSLPKIGIPQKYKTERVFFALDKKKVKRLEAIAEKYQVTKNLIFQVVWGSILAHYNNTKDVVFGAVVSGRPSEIRDVESIVGLFMNTIPVRIRHEEDTNFSELLLSLKKDFYMSQNFDYLPLSEIQSMSSLGTHLLDHIMVFQNQPLEINSAEESDQADQTDWSIAQSEAFEQSPYDFNIRVSPGEEIYVELIFNTVAYKQSWVENVKEQILLVIDQVLNNPEIRVKDLEFLTEDQKHLILNEFNSPIAPYGEDTLLSLFAEQVQTRAGNIALSYNGQSWTYEEVDKISDAIAHQLKKDLQVNKGDIVATLVDNPYFNIIGMLAIMKIGAVYLPIDPTYPEERKQFIINDSGIAALITVSDFLFSIDYFSGGLLAIDVIDFEGSISEMSQPVSEQISPEDLAYTIYTSGSTGNPKGALIAHRAVANMVKAQIEEFGIQPEDNVLQFASSAFDASISEIFMALLSGASLVLLDRNLITRQQEFLEYLKDNEISVATFPPSFMSTFDKEALQHLRVIITAGEKANADYSNYLSQHAHVFNAYGPTECSVCVSTYRIPQAANYHEIPIGRPIKNMQVYILDDTQKMVSVGAKGEIYVAGHGLANAYLNRPDLTKEKFVTSPISSSTLYRTGDIGYWLPNGDLAYIGRVDDQIKIRGHRIEMGEIQNTLLRHEEVLEALVVVLKNAQKEDYLACYYISQQNNDLENLSQHLRKYLPEYMIPLHFRRLDQFPLNVHGKIDRKALPPIEGEKEGAISLPETKLEKQLLSVWKEVLGQGEIGIHDDFFALGGHSLKATQMVSKIHKELDIKVEIAAVFDNPTIHQLAQHLDALTHNTFVEIPQIEKRQYYDVSSAQKRLWITYELEEKQIAYSTPMALSLKGQLDIKALQNAFLSLIDRHESLRTIFKSIDGIPKQQVLETKALNFKISEIDLTKEQDKSRAIEKIIDKDAHTPFSLEQGPLLRLTLIKQEEQYHIFLFNIHHIVTDGWSMKILTDEISTLYNSLVKNISDPLPTLRIQYKDYAHWHNQRRGEEHRNYWLKEFGGDIPLLKLNTDFKRPTQFNQEGSSYHGQFQQALTGKIQAAVQENQTTLFTLLFACFNSFIAKLTHQEDIVVGYPVHGREHKDLEGLIGMFVNMLAIRTRPRTEMTFLELLKETQAKVLEAIEHSSFQYEELIQELDIKPMPGRNPIFDVVFQAEDLRFKDVSKQNNNEEPQLIIEPFEKETHAAHFDLLFSVTNLNDGTLLTVNYATQLFKEETIKEMVDDFMEYVSVCLDNMNKPLADIKVSHDFIQADLENPVEDESDFVFD